MLNWMKKGNLQKTLGLVFAVTLVASGCSPKDTGSETTPNTTSQPQQLVGQAGDVIQPDGLWYGEVVEDRSLLKDKELEEVAILTVQAGYDDVKNYDLINMITEASQPFDWEGWTDDGTGLLVTALVTNDNTKVELFHVNDYQEDQFVLGDKIGESIFNRWEAFRYYSLDTEGLPVVALRITSEDGKEVIVPGSQFDGRGTNTEENETYNLYTYNVNNDKYVDRAVELGMNFMIIVWDKIKQANGMYVYDMDMDVFGDEGIRRQQMSVDLDSDGTKEDIRSESGNYTYEGDQTMVLPGECTINGEPFQYENILPMISFYEGQEMPYQITSFDVIDINPFDGKKEFLLFRHGFEMDTMVSYFHYDKGTWTHLGDTEGYGDTGFKFYGTIDQENSEIEVSQVNQYFCTSFYNRTYKLENEKIIPIKITEEKAIRYGNGEQITATVSADFNLYKDPQGNELSQVVMPGDGITILSSNLESWVKVRTNSGKTGYIIYEYQGQQEDGWDIYGLRDQGGLQPYDVLEGLPYAG